MEQVCAYKTRHGDLFLNEDEAKRSERLKDNHKLIQAYKADINTWSNVLASLMKDFGMSEMYARGWALKFSHHLHWEKASKRFSEALIAIHVAKEKIEELNKS